MKARFLHVMKRTGTVFAKCIQYGCLYHCITTYGVSCVTCDGKSMEPTIYHGDAYIVECVSVHRQTLKRGDVIGVKSLDDPNKFICKRIVAMAGDKVYNEVSNERIWVPKGHVWLEGDNKICSHDSRHYGPVPYGLIFCKLIFRIWTGHQHKVHMSKDR
ncbi:mitochondrial inner membrane protease subunit 1-like [Ruditapes philippinarum]|uniref:mitochondrial inner membrane protease subunit 1-like n=1 Tax=Ruditapes philippinarum TaxID=129788 RepID=UPI00295B1AC2|nr:mitochondrial inner membrane protease subunit 1-like [Ruditapes philippinarum]XP_060564693.1 mitochondrial inner membrane protease subunit 1-like [Ruditapes philippinarum]